MQLMLEFEDDFELSEDTEHRAGNIYFIESRRQKGYFILARVEGERYALISIFGYDAGNPWRNPQLLNSCSVYGLCIGEEEFKKLLGSLPRTNCRYAGRIEMVVEQCNLGVVERCN